MAQASVFAYRFDPGGNRREIGWQEIRQWTPEAGSLWLVGRPDGEETQRWLRLESGLEPDLIRTLLRTDNRPQCAFHKTGLLLCLRATSHAPQRGEDEMTGVNLWVDAQRLIVIRSAPVLLFQEIRDDIKQGEVSVQDTGDLLALVIQRLIARVEPLLMAIDDAVDDLEDSTLLEPGADLQQELAALRHRMILLRRHLLPQHEALSLLQGRRLGWLTESCRQTLQEGHGQLHQFLGDLDSMRERAQLIQDEITNQQNRKLNETMKIVAVFTAYLMPVNAITSLLGTNVEGIPGQAGSGPPWGFTLEVLVLILIMVISYFVFKKLKWFS